ncbi:hypothetical protein [Massilia glaciei]|uniref:Uncharacterized protein n=1 Tax=Massilia glaciei TaxID=1524097 RepID=A0A2U2HAZ2_9BURK|nr:hypothetical protein [Massilia glaciei]PWF39965.1 hypothetical protein C7C56_026390 [Massilia glaciei]
MTQAWVTLTDVDGREIDAPTEDELAEALAAVYATADDASAALRFGYDDGLMYVAEVSAEGRIRFEEWSDRDCEMALALPRSMRASQSEALALWRFMARRQVSKIRELAWA